MDSRLARIEFRIKRTYVESTAGESTMRSDRLAHRVSADSATAAALNFISGDNARILGAVKELPSGEVTATAWREGRVYVIFVDRWEEQADGEARA
jgi:hypothetical protein